MWLTSIGTIILNLSVCISQISAIEETSSDILSDIFSTSLQIFSRFYNHPEFDQGKLRALMGIGSWIHNIKFNTQLFEIYHAVTISDSDFTDKLQTISSSSSSIEQKVASEIKNLLQ